MTETTTTQDAVSVAKELGKLAAKQAAISAVEAVAAVALLAAIGFAAHKYTERKNKKAAEKQD